MVHQHRQIGNEAEHAALEYLKSNGLSLVVANFSSRFGEIDLIMSDNEGYVFVEVKKRKLGLNHAIESINYSKQQKMIKTAQYFLLKLGRDVNCRFDAVVLDSEGRIEWLKNIITL